MLLTGSTLAPGSHVCLGRVLSLCAWAKVRAQKVPVGMPMVPSVFMPPRPISPHTELRPGVPQSHHPLADSCTKLPQDVMSR